MHKLKRFLLLLPLLIVAGALYYVGALLAAAVIVGVAALIELAFWVGVFRLFKPRKYKFDP